MNIKKILLNCVNWVLTGIVGLFGFNGCVKYGPNMYGTPSADYTVKGAVVNEATGDPVKGIRVGYSPQDWQDWDEELHNSHEYFYYPYDYVLSNEDGVFKLTGRSFPDLNKILTVYIEDIDGEENGSFKSKTIEADFKDAEHSGKSGAWYKGEYTITKNIELADDDSAE